MSSNIEKAFVFMRKAHSSQKRKHGAPYDAHPEAVFNILTSEFAGSISEDAQVIALLHDTLEMGASEAEIEWEFGREILKGVKLLSRQKAESFAEYANRLHGAPREIRLVKAADRLHNLRDALFANDREWAIDYVRETREHILPIVEDQWFLTKLAEAMAIIERAEVEEGSPKF